MTDALGLVFGGKQRGRVGLIEFDAFTSENHGASAELTSFPVERGADIRDHYRRKNDSLSINAVVSNAPLVLLASARQPSPILGDITPVSDRVALAYGELQRIMRDAELVTVLTTLREYENMALVGMTVDRNASTANALAVSMSFEEVIIAASEEVAAIELPSPVKPSNQKPKNLGKKATTAASTKTAQKTGSLLSRGIGALFGG